MTGEDIVEIERKFLMDGFPDELHHVRAGQLPKV